MEYLLIASRDAFESREAQRDYELAAELARSGATVTMFLIQNGVLAARPSAASAALAALGSAGIALLADDFSLRERGIRREQLCVDERGAAESIPGTRRGSPADLVKFIDAADNTLVVPTR